MFLNEIIEKKRAYLEERKRTFPLSSIEMSSTDYSGDIFIKNLKSEGVNIIAEIKKASPAAVPDVPRLSAARMWASATLSI